jgi:beta-glucosidase
MRKKEERLCRSSLGWGIQPKALYWAPRFLCERYHKPIVIRKNGMANTDVVSLDGRVHDPQRKDYLRRYLREFRRAGEDGMAIGGYFLVVHGKF